jgi:hypothetical protein
MAEKLLILGLPGSGKSIAAYQYMSSFIKEVRMEFLLAPTWISIFVSIVGVIIALFLPIILFIKQRNRKQISCEIISDRSLLSIGKEVEPNVQVLFVGKPVGDLREVILKLRNTGNVPIEVKDYENNNPIEINFGAKAEVLKAELLETVPIGLKVRAEASFKLDRVKVHLEPLLLNAQDSITIRVLLSGYNSDLNVVARIAGVKQIPRSN